METRVVGLRWGWGGRKRLWLSEGSRRDACENGMFYISVPILVVILNYSCAKLHSWGVWVKGPWGPSVFFLTMAWQSAIIQNKKSNV